MNPDLKKAATTHSVTSLWLSGEKFLDSNGPSCGLVVEINTVLPVKSLTLQIKPGAGAPTASVSRAASAGAQAAQNAKTPEAVLRGPGGVGFVHPYFKTQQEF